MEAPLLMAVAVARMVVARTAHQAAPVATVVVQAMVVRRRTTTALCPASIKPSLPQLRAAFLR